MNRSTSIFVGNLAYGADEEELKEIFSKAGDVTGIRLVCDRDTNMPRGYCFVDFADSNAVQNAMQNYNNVEYKGRRLRVDAADRGKGSDSGKGAGRGPPGAGFPGAEPVPLPMPVITAADRQARIREHEDSEKARAAAFEQAELAEIARFMETFTPQQLFTVFGEMQRLSLRAPEVARALIAENTQLCVALQHAQFLLGLADEAQLPTDPEVRERARNVRQKVYGKGIGGSIPAPPGGFPPLGSLPTAPGLLGFPMAGLPTAAPDLVQLGALASALAGAATLAAAATRPVGVPSMPGVPGVSGVPAPPAAVKAEAAAAAAPTATPGVPADEEGKKELLEKLSKLSPQQIDQLPQQTKVAVLGFLQSLPQQEQAK